MVCPYLNQMVEEGENIVLYLSVTDRKFIRELVSSSVLIENHGLLLVLI